MGKKAKRRFASFIIYAIFVILKWIGVINWSWWIVLLPALVFGGIIAMALIYCITYLILEFFFDDIG